MGVATEKFQSGDIWFYYDYEDVMFRYDFAAKKFYRKFLGESTEDEVPFDNHLLNEARRFGEEISQTAYDSGKPK